VRGWGEGEIGERDGGGGGVEGSGDGRMQTSWDAGMAG